jgi:hypothetical protein
MRTRPNLSTTMPFAGVLRVANPTVSIVPSRVTSDGGCAPGFSRSLLGQTRLKLPVEREAEPSIALATS